jgi:hypothetical protein
MLHSFVLFSIALLLIPTPLHAQLPTSTLSNFRSFGFGMVSYYDAVTSNQSQAELISFINVHNISFLNQYVCSTTSPAQYASFIDNIYNQTGAKINMLFDKTLVEHSHNSTCDIECLPSASTGPGWCCGSVARKFAWMVEVLKLTTQPNALDGAAFDIEGLKAKDYIDLWTTMRTHWNNTVAVVKGTQVLRWYFGSVLADLAVEAVAKGLIDQIYWENYQNTNGKYVARAQRLLAPLNEIYLNQTHIGHPVCLLSEINCCATPCIHSNNCGECHSHALEERQLISFCSANDAKKMTLSKGSDVDGQRQHRAKMDVDYMLATLKTSRAELSEYHYMLAPNVLYDYRAIFMKIYGRDTKGKHFCLNKGISEDFDFLDISI